MLPQGLCISSNIHSPTKTYKYRIDPTWTTLKTITVNFLCLMLSSVVHFKNPTFASQPCLHISTLYLYCTFTFFDVTFFETRNLQYIKNISSLRVGLGLLY